MLTRRLFVACAALLAVSSWAGRSVLAQADAGAGAFIQSLGNEAIATFSDKSVPRDQSVQKFRTLLYRGFDVPYIGRFVLGRFWNQATPQQQDEYQKLFEKMIVATYADRFVEYSGETFKITGSRPEGDTDAVVTTQIVRPNGPPVNVDWRVRKRDAGFKIIDVIVEGVSMSVTQRSEFASVISSSGGQIEGLLRAMRQKTGTAG
ncbi:MlaC/ttg2D family ABC transporter substrate-binding protein [Azospirillum thermophilum]|uniref:Toluene tolerance protein n=1 Tax=Azospirillum thermophilum TaxID=2202148 RepID=A0A2S2CQ82_9PROT|nr:ABC transporter substrate-binding protein [Azospirillum thermophilum]AWK86632.1 toluene tolerance protein [Azospirillum thermophilum]